MTQSSGKRRIRWGLISSLILLLAVLLAAGFLGYRYLRVENIVVTGNSAVSSADIAMQSGIVLGTHYLEFDADAAKRHIEENPYLVAEEISFAFPDTVNIKVRERKVEAVLRSMERSIFIDDECRVLDITTDANLSGILLITGVAVTGAATGEIVAVVDDYQLEALKMLLSSLERTNTYSAYASADFTFSVDIWLTTPEGMAVRVGQAHELDEKLIAVASVMADLYGKGVRTGTLSATDPASVTYAPALSFGPETPGDGQPEETEKLDPTDTPDDEQTPTPEDEPEDKPEDEPEDEPEDDSRPTPTPPNEEDEPDEPLD